MTTPDEEIQAAADRGELQSKSNERLRQSADAAERRWIVMQVKEIATHQQLTPDQFKELCRWIREFTAGELSALLPPS